MDLKQAKFVLDTENYKKYPKIAFTEIFEEMEKAPRLKRFIKSKGCNTPVKRRKCYRDY